MALSPEEVLALTYSPVNAAIQQYNQGRLNLALMDRQEQMRKEAEAEQLKRVLALEQMREASAMELERQRDQRARDLQKDLFTQQTALATQKMASEIMDKTGIAAYPPEPENGYPGETAAEYIARVGPQAHDIAITDLDKASTRIADRQKVAANRAKAENWQELSGEPWDETKESAQAYSARVSALMSERGANTYAYLQAQRDAAQQAADSMLATLKSNRQNDVVRQALTSVAAGDTKLTKALQEATAAYTSKGLKAPDLMELAGTGRFPKLDAAVANAMASPDFANQVDLYRQQMDAKLPVAKDPRYLALQSQLAEANRLFENSQKPGFDKTVIGRAVLKNAEAWSKQSGSAAGPGANEPTIEQLLGRGQPIGNGAPTPAQPPVAKPTSSPPPAVAALAPAPWVGRIPSAIRSGEQQLVNAYNGIPSLPWMQRSAAGLYNLTTSVGNLGREWITGAPQRPLIDMRALNDQLNRQRAPIATNPAPVQTVDPRVLFPTNPPAPGRFTITPNGIEPLMNPNLFIQPTRDPYTQYDDFGNPVAVTNSPALLLGPTP